MSDIFDDVEKMLAEEMSSTDSVEVSAENQNFNDDELEDIMAEIESLENDFEESPEKSEDRLSELSLDSLKVPRTDLQKTIDEEIALITPHLQASVIPEIKEIAPMNLVENKFENPVYSSSNSKKEMSFQAVGNMAITFDFKDGDREAKLFIDEQKGLVVSFSGVEVSISEESGCSVSMENGVNFNIPLTTDLRGPKKKAA
jgi:hypothetical protein